MAGKQKFLELEAVRGIAALFVALYHFPTTSFIYENDFVKNADLMVDLFFVISGFVISYNYFDRITSKTDLLDFQIKRFWRLYPLHIVTFLLFLGFDIVRQIIQGASAEGTAVWVLAIFNIFLVQSIFADQLSFNFPSWSISTEFYTYFAFGLLAFFAGKFRTYAMSIFFIFTILGCFYFSAFDDVVGYPILRCFYGFFAGVILQRLYNLNCWDNVTKLFSPIAWLIISVATVFFYDRLAAWLPVFIFLGLIFSLTLHSGENSLTTILSSTILQYLGKISYSIYLWHAFIIFVIVRVCQNFLDSETILIQGVGVKLILETHHALLLTIFYMATLVLISAFSSKYIERIRYKSGRWTNVGF